MLSKNDNICPLNATDFPKNFQKISTTVELKSCQIKNEVKEN